MAHGFMGKILWVDLAKKQIKEEPLDEKMGRDFLGGYGLGAQDTVQSAESRRGPAGTGSHSGHGHRGA